VLMTVCTNYTNYADGQPWGVLQQCIGYLHPNQWAVDVGGAKGAEHELCVARCAALFLGGGI
jgi:hypothetical protein